MGWFGGGMGYDELIDAVQDHAGLASRSEAEAVARAVFRSIARRVLPGDRRAVKALLPAQLVALFDEAGEAVGGEVDAIVTEVAAVEGIAPGFGREHLLVVCSAASSTLHPDAITALRAHLPDVLGDLFVAAPASRVARPTPQASPRAGRRLSEAGDESRHLARGRVGSAHPLSEAKADRAQSESVARSDNPHGDIKLSTAEGLTQDREHESLSDGKE